MGVAAEKGVLETEKKHERFYYYKLAASNGQLVSKFFLVREDGSRLRRLLLLPYALFLLMKIVVLRSQNPSDYRTLI